MCIEFFGKVGLFGFGIYSFYVMRRYVGFWRFGINLIVFLALCILNIYQLIVILGGLNVRVENGFVKVLFVRILCYEDCFFMEYFLEIVI